jgi:thiol-disulfide isomerase/thioredoxin
VLPVAGLAAGAYLAMIIASFSIGPTTEAPVRRLAWRAMLVLMGSAAGSAIWFTILQKWVIGEFCPYCMATHLTGVLLAALVIWLAPRQFDNDLRTTPVQDASVAAPRRVIGRWPALGLAGVGLVLAGIMAVCQIAFAPPPVYRVGEAQAKIPALDPGAVPLVGSPKATYVITLFYDYKCPHCQQLHGMLDEVIKRYNGKVAFILCPAPLNSECNPYIARDRAEFKDSCELAKMGLAVWVAKREAFSAFDNWMYSAEPEHLWRPRSLEAARAKAIELVGAAKFDAARANPWVEGYMQTSIQVYGNTIDSTGNSLPRLALGENWVTPEPNNVDDLIWVLIDSLGLPHP